MANTHCRICGRELFPEILLELKNILQPASETFFAAVPNFPDKVSRILLENQIKELSC